MKKRTAKPAKKSPTKAARAKQRVFKTPRAAARALKARAVKATKPAAKLDRTTPSAPDAISRALVRLVMPEGFPPRPADTRWPGEIKIGQRHRKDFGNLAGLAQSIDARGDLIQAVAINPQDELVAGQRRLKAWPLTKFRDQPIPVRVISIDSIIAGEWDENAQRKDFTPSESAAIADEIEKQLKVLAKQRQRSGKKADAPVKGNASDQAARIAGRDRRTIDKARDVVKAAEQDPERFGKLKEDMDRTGKVNGPHRRMQTMQQIDALKKAPPQLPMNGPYEDVVIDYPWPDEPGKSQEAIDAAGRSTRPYPPMAIEAGLVFMAEKVAPILAKDCAVWMLTTNFHMPYAYQLLAAMGLTRVSTILTWKKQTLGKGQVLRDQTEHCLIARRGNPLWNLTNETTFLEAARREHSRKPDELYDLVERISPSPRYAEIFSRGGRGPNWDCHGDQVGKFAPADARAAEAELQADARAATPSAVTPGLDPGVHDATPPDRPPLVEQLVALEELQRGVVPSVAGMQAFLEEMKWCTRGGHRRKPKLTDAGTVRLGGLRMMRERGEAPPGDEAKPIRRTLPGRDAVLIQFAERNGHVVRMHGDDADHIGTCECGAEWRFPRADRHKQLDEAITAHWREHYERAQAAQEQQPTADEPAAATSEESGGPGAASAALSGEAEGDGLDIPGFLRRADKPAPESATTLVNPRLLPSAADVAAIADRAAGRAEAQRLVRRSPQGEGGRPEARAK